MVYPGNVEVEPGANCWSDGDEEWAHHRWPYNAGTVPSYSDRKLKFSPAAHIDRIGSTWWNWKTRKSVAVAFDIDLEDEHAPSTVTVDENQLEEIVGHLKGLPYVTLVRSTGGGGVHAYVFFEPSDQPDAANHNEHTQVALATLAKMSADADFEFSKFMDAKGLVFWFYANASGEGHPGFTLIHEHTAQIGSADVEEYRDRSLPKPKKSRTFKGFTDSGEEAESDGEGDGYKVCPLDDEHRSILGELEDLDYTFIWHADYNMAHTHTRALKELYDRRLDDEKPLKGMFETNSQGTDPSKPNCYITPRPDGVFQVKRFGNGIAEHASWQQKDQDTWCYLNKETQVSTIFENRATRVDGHKMTFKPAELEAALRDCGHSLGESVKQIDAPITVTRRKDGTFRASFEGGGNYEGWKAGKKDQFRVLPVIEKPEARKETLLETVDMIARFLVTPQHEPYGWALKTNIGWIMHGGFDGIGATVGTIFGKEAKAVKSMMEMNPWVLTCVPFGPTYPPPDPLYPHITRLWNLKAPQFAIEPAEAAAPHPHWDKIYNHLGASLDTAVRTTTWCQEWGLESGADYLRFWVAAMIQYPFEPLPYLFFYGPQNSGKSIFHEAIGLLFTKGSVESASGALSNNQGFNYEIANAILGHIEEKDLAAVRGTAYARMKEWATGLTLTVTKKGETPYTQRNVLKFCHMANRPTACPMEDGDTRITALAVAVLASMIPKGYMMKKLMEEAPAFLRTLLTTHIPDTPDRLRVPMLKSADKADLEAMNQEPWEAFAAETLFPCAGETVKFSEFYDEYITYCTCNNIPPMKLKALAQLVRNRSDKYLMGHHRNKQVHIGNVTLDPMKTSSGLPLVLNEKGRLVKCTA
jgi:hypothetical protein